MTRKPDCRFAEPAAERPGPVEVATRWTELGWLALAWTGSEVEAISFGWSSAGQAAEQLQQRLPVHRLGRRPAIAMSGQQRPAAAGLDQATRTDSLTDILDRLGGFAAGEPVHLEAIAINDRGYTPFQQTVLRRCRQIPRGTTLTYGELAARCGRPGAARAVGNVMRCNRFPLVVPCHRVLAAGGRLGGYSAPRGLETKRRLLRMEQLA